MHKVVLRALLAGLLGLPVIGLGVARVECLTTWLSQQCRVRVDDGHLRGGRSLVFDCRLYHYPRRYRSGATWKGAVDVCPGIHTIKAPLWTDMSTLSA